MHSIQYEQSEIVIRLPKNTVSSQILEQFLERLNIDEIRQQSLLTQNQADELAGEVKKSTWQALKHYVK